MKTRVDNPAVFRDKKHVFEADTCQPVLEAVSAGELKLYSLARGSYPGERLRRQELQGLRSFGLWDAKGDQHWGLPYHRNEGIEFTMMLSGEMPISVGDFHGLLKPGNMMITRPWQPHRIGNPCFAPGKLAWLIIDVGIRHPHQNWKWPSWIILEREDLTDLTRYLSHNEQQIRSMPKALCDCFAGLCQIPASPDSTGRTSKISVMVNNMLVLLLEACRSSNVKLSPGNVSAERTVKLFIEGLGADLRRSWTVETMAEACGLGVTRFTHYFQQITNETPAHYLGKLRLQAAEAMLLKVPGPGLEIVSRECGFSRASYFIHAFKAKHGCSPGKYRAAATSKNAKAY